MCHGGVFIDNLIDRRVECLHLSSIGEIGIITATCGAIEKEKTYELKRNKEMK